MIKKNWFYIVMLIIISLMYKEMQTLVNRINDLQLEILKTQYLIDNIRIQQYRTIFWNNDNNQKER